MKLITACLVLGLVGCGDTGAPGKDGNNGSDGRTGAPGKDGNNGKTGNNGKDGKSFATAASDLVNKISPLTKNVLDIECVSGGWRGSGTKTTDGNIITAYHVVSGCTAARYYSEGVLVGSGGTFSGTFDVAKIKGINWNSEGLLLPGILAPTKHFTPELGSLVVTVSYPAELVDNVQVALGFVTDTQLQNAPLYWYDAFLTDAAAAAGSSGGPVFDSEGNFVAIHVGGWDVEGLELNIQMSVIP